MRPARHVRQHLLQNLYLLYLLPSQYLLQSPISAERSRRTCRQGFNRCRCQ